MIPIGGTERSGFTCVYPTTGKINHWSGSTRSLGEKKTFHRYFFISFVDLWLVSRRVEHEQFFLLKNIMQKCIVEHPTMTNCQYLKLLQHRKEKISICLTNLILRRKIILTVLSLLFSYTHAASGKVRVLSSLRIVKIQTSLKTFSSCRGFKDWDSLFTIIPCCKTLRLDDETSRFFQFLPFNVQSLIKRRERNSKL